MPTTPQPIIDVLTSCQGLKDTADASAVQLVNGQAAVTSAQSALTALQTKATSDAQALQNGLQQLDAVINAYFQPGATAPTPPPPAAPAIPPSAPSAPAGGAPLQTAGVGS